MKKFGITLAVLAAVSITACSHDDAPEAPDGIVTQGAITQDQAVAAYTQSAEALKGEDPIMAGSTAINNLDPAILDGLRSGALGDSEDLLDAGDLHINASNDLESLRIIHRAMGAFQAEHDVTNPVPLSFQGNRLEVQFDVSSMDMSGNMVPDDSCTQSYGFHTTPVPDHEGYSYVVLDSVDPGSCPADTFKSTL